MAVHSLEAVDIPQADVPGARAVCVRKPSVCHGEHVLGNPDIAQVLNMTYAQQQPHTQSHSHTATTTVTVAAAQRLGMGRELCTSFKLRWPASPFTSSGSRSEMSHSASCSESNLAGSSSKRANLPSAAKSAMPLGWRDQASGDHLFSWPM